MKQYERRYKGGSIVAKIYDVIKYEGDNDVFIWKHPCEDFNSLTQLIVQDRKSVV